MFYGREQQERWRFCGIVAKIWDLLDTVDFEVSKEG